MAKKGAILTIAILLTGYSLWAGGWNNTLMGCRALGLGGAFTAVADDPSAIFHNPAGLVFQRSDFNFSIDGFYVWPTHQYTMPSGAKINSKYNNPLPQVFITYRTSEKITLGFGMFVPYAGGGVDWKKNDLGYPLKSVLGIYSLTPTLAYQVSEKLSLGFNIYYYRAMLKVNTEMLYFGSMCTEESGTALSAGFGLMFRPNEKVGIGMSIRGPTKMNISGICSMDYEGYKLNLDSETSFNLPWDIEVGLSYRITDNFLFSTSAQYTMWSTLDKVEKTIKNIPLTGDMKVDEKLDFKNILIWRAGFEYVLPQGIALRAGMGIDRSASPEETLSITNIDVDKISIVGGIGYRAGKMQIDFTYIYALGKEREKRLSGFTLPEKYDLDVFILGLGITFSL
ncbi:MAG: OmpP1/FadL family transporter [Candidatus Aminicenantaceae bacterium]